jgi:integrase
MLLARCKVAGRCLILSAIAEQKETQTTLPKIGSFDGLSGCIDDLLTAKRNANRRERYVKSLGYYLRQFAKGREQTAISDFTFSHVEDWISRYPAAVTRQTWLNRISTLFAFAVRRGLIVANPCDRIERVTVDRKPPLILTPAQSRALLAATPTVMKPYVVLGMFAGIRPEEITRLDWSQISLDAGTVAVDGKTRRRRTVTLEPVAVAALKNHPLRHGAVTPSNSTVDRWRNKARLVLGFPRWPQDLLRHTAASYLLALHQDAAKVALRLGNSEKILMSHYYSPVNGDCGHFWQTDSLSPCQSTIKLGASTP